MKKYSVFVKFSNAMDRGGMGKEDDDIKVDNVICRTPARNAQSLDLVKQEIMDMVEKVVCETLPPRSSWLGPSFNPMKFRMPSMSPNVWSSIACTIANCSHA